MPVRARVAEVLARGSIQASLTVDRSGAAPTVHINSAVLEAVLAAIRQIKSRVDATPPSLDGLLAIKGVMEISDAEESEEEKRSA